MWLGEYRDLKRSKVQGDRGCVALVAARFGGSWVVIRRVAIFITHIKGLFALLITTPEPPSKVD